MSNISVSITADVADLQVKRAILSAELKAATKDLNQFAKEAAATGSTDALRAGMLASADAAQKAKASIALVNTELKELAAAAVPATEHMGTGFGAATAKVREMGVQVRETFEVIEGFKAMLSGIAEAMIAAFAVERIAEWARSVGEAAEKIYHTSLTFGMTTKEVQKFQGEMVALGIPVDAATAAFQRLDRAALQAREGNQKLTDTFDELGINIKVPISQTELFQRTIAGLAEIQDVPTRIGVAMQLLGKNIQDIAPLIGLTKEQIAEAKRVVEEYGYANDDAVAKGLALAEAFNTNTVAMQGLTNVMVQEFAPGLIDVIQQMDGMIKAFIESYQRGGAAKQMLEDFAVVCKLLVQIIADVIAIFVALFEIINAVAYLVQSVLDPAIEGIKTAFKLLGDEVVYTGKIIWDALHLDWDGIRADFRAGLGAMADDALQGGRNIANAFTSGLKGASDSLSIGEGAMSAADKLADALFGAGTKRQFKVPEANRNNNKNNFNTDEIGGGSKGKKGKGESISEKLEEDLEKAKTEYAMLQDAQGTYQQYSLQSEADFWAKALQRTDLTAKDRLSIERKYLAARAALLKEKQAAETDDAKHSEAIALEIATNDIALAKVALEEKLAIIDEEERAGAISAQRAMEQRTQINAKIYALDAQAEQREFEIKLKALKAEMAIQGERPGYYRQIANQIDVLTQQHLDKMVLLNKQADLKMQRDNQQMAQATRSMWQGIYQPYAQEIAKMLTLQQNFFATLRGLWSNLQQVVAQAINRMVTDWLVGLTIKEANSHRFHLTEVMHSAKQAAAGAYAAIVKIPFVGPILAPPAAAAAFAATMAFSAEGGDWQVKEGLYQLHRNEMVLPAWAANPLRDMLTGSNDNSGGSSPSLGGGGETHNHYHQHLHGTIIQGPRDLERWAKKNSHAFGAGLQQYVRNGGR